MEAALLGLGGLWIYLIHASNDRIRQNSKSGTTEVPVMSIREIGTTGDTSDMWRFNESGKAPIATFVGQFGLSECMRADRTSYCTRTWDIGLEKF